MSTSMVPRNKDLASFDVNMGGAEYLRRVIVVLGFEDASYLSGTGGGSYIAAQEARTWGQALTKVLQDGTLHDIEVHDECYARNKRTVPEILDNKEPIVQLTAPRLAKEDREWLETFASFLINCRGFWMY